VPAEKKLIKSDNPLIHQGTAPPPAKKDFMLLPAPEKDRPQMTTIRENTTIVIRSKYPIGKISGPNLYVYLLPVKLLAKKIAGNVSEIVLNYRKRFRNTADTNIFV
jgi:hypothetical protein